MFTLANWACISSSLNQGQLTVTPFGGVPTVVNAPNVFVYKSPTDTVAIISAANYFLSLHDQLSVGDIILGSGTDASLSLTVTAVSDTSVTVASMGLTTAIGTANIVDAAVTTAKLANNAVTSAKLATNVLQYAVVPITSAEFLGMFAAPKLLVPAAGANTLLVLDKVDLLMTFNSAAYAAGGLVAIQYGSTPAGAGVIASNTATAVSFTAGAGTGFVFSPGTVTQPFTTSVNQGFYLSNITGAFTTGNSAFTAHVWYKVIPTI